MEPPPFPPRPEPRISPSEVAFFLFLALFIVVACMWPILTARIHHISTWTPDAVHTFSVHERGVTVYMTPQFGRFYINLPWIWCTLLALAVITGLLSDTKPGGRK